MKVQWERRRPDNEFNGNALNLEAVLVESYQENGNISQRVVAHLGCIGEKFLTTKVRNMREFHKGLFWVAVDSQLDHLKLGSALRSQIEAEILTTVSRPDEDWALWGVTCIPRFDP
jgi:hypothetical protein